MSIKVERVKSGKSIKETCEHMGVSRMTLYKWENGKGNPKASRLPELASYFGCSVDALLSDSR